MKSSVELAHDHDRVCVHVHLVVVNLIVGVDARAIAGSFVRGPRGVTARAGRKQ